MKFRIVVLMFALMLALVSSVRAQEPELINEIVARVNNDIITRADYLNALADFKSELAKQMQQGGKSEAEISAEFDRLKPTVLDLMIEDLLLQQKAKELGIDVEAEVNQRMIELSKENGFKNALEFENALKQQGLDPDQLRGNLRKQLQQQYVVNREVLQPIFMSVRDKDRREYYDKHKEVFMTQGEVTISEIFLPLEGYTAADVEQRARRLIEELRAGLSFADAVQKHSPASRASRAQGGRLGTFKPGELKPDIAKAISTLKVGEATEPIRIQEGYQIIRVDERKESTLRPFEDAQVQDYLNRAVTFERADEARKKFLAKLREEAYIKITKGYLTAQPQAKPDEKVK
jgi:peptidyl-prolyl cis-trans isomerase SurA